MPTRIHLPDNIDVKVPLDASLVAERVNTSHDLIKFYTIDNECVYIPPSQVIILYEE